MGHGTLWCALAIAWVGADYPAAGQTHEPSTEELLKEIRLLRQRLEALEEKHEEDQRRIQELESRLDRLETPPAPEEQAKQIEEIKTAIKAESGEPRPSGGLFDLSVPGLGGGNLLNPQITVFVETGGSLSSRSGNKALNRFNLREVELDFRAAISPSADGVLILAIEEEIESNRDGRIDIERVFDVEEAYIDFHTLPWDLSLKAGKFRNAVGRNNLLHTHDLPQVTRPLAVTKFLGPEGLATTGASLSWLIPNPWDKYLELKAEIVNADGGEEAPILGGPNAENPAVLAHLKFFDDVTETSSFEIGGTYLFGRTSEDRDFDANVFGLDLTYHWVHPDPSKFRSLILQTELFWADNDIDRGFFRSERNSSFGAYAFGQYQLNRDWYAGLRADYTEFPNSESRGSDDWDFALSPYVTWYVTEFLRGRVEYQHRFLEVDGSSRDEDALFLQFTAVFGAHPPHPYWVRR